MHLNKNMGQPFSQINQHVIQSPTYQLYPLHTHLKDNPYLLSQDSLNQLAILSNLIEEPQIYGEFNNEAHYLNTLKLVLDSTRETKNRVSFFLKHIIPLLQQKNNLLDIGPGDGSLTKSIAPFFKHLTAVDLNHHILDNLSKHLPQELNFKPLIKSILTAQYTANHYDLAVLSHMLYYIDARHWIKAIQSVFYSLKCNGVLVVALGGDEFGKAQLIKHFGGMTIPTDELAEQCMEMFGREHVSLFASNESFQANNQQTMRHITAFMLYPTRFKSLVLEIENYH